MTLHYPFPVINTIHDVLPHIDNNFRVVEKEGLTFINYKMMGSEVFPHIHRPEVINVMPNHAAHRAAVRRECRGIAFDTESGEIVSRPFHKFFNAGERDDVAVDKIDVSKEHIALEKLDGSMIRPLPTSGGIRWGTKMGITDTALLAEEHVADRNSYYALATYFMAMGATPLFEFCSRKNRIVVDYKDDSMVLLAARSNVTGEYIDRAHITYVADMYGIPVVDSVDARGEFDEGAASNVSDITAMISSVKDASEGEGKVLVFSDGHAVKVKSDWYVRVHRAKDMMRSEMRLLSLYFNDELDDLMAAIPEDDRARIEDYLSRYQHAFGRVVDGIGAHYIQVRGQFDTKKDFALSAYAKEKVTGPWKSLMFALWDGKLDNPHDAATYVISGALTSETKFAEMKAAMNMDTGWDDVWAEHEKEAA